jgi:hypothetical protein
MLRNTLIFAIIFGSFTIEAQEETTFYAEETDSIIRGSVVINAGYEITNLLNQYEKENEGKQIQGYRIQLFSGNKKGAFDLKADFMRKIPETPITVVYEAPDFKSQAGNYRSKLEAEKALETIWPQYKSAFIVKTKIDLPTLLIDQE